MGYFKNHPILRAITDAGLVIAAMAIIYNAGYVAGYHEAETFYHTLNAFNTISFGNIHGGIY